MSVEKYSKVAINDNIARENANLLSDAEFEVNKAFEKGQFNLEDRKKITELANELNELRKKQAALIGSGKKEY